VLYPSYEAPPLTTGGNCRMMSLLIGIVGWLATFGLIAAIIAEAFH
jgi:hypothetical protein